MSIDKSSRGCLSRLKRERDTKAVLASRMLTSDEKMKMANETTDTFIMKVGSRLSIRFFENQLSKTRTKYCASVQLKFENAFSTDMEYRYLSSTTRMLSTSLSNESSQFINFIIFIDKTKCITFLTSINLNERQLFLFFLYFLFK